MAHPRLRVSVNCATCGKSFEVVPSKIKKSLRSFCSMECRNVALRAPRKKQSDRLTVQCAVCGADKVITPSYKARNKTGMFFCSDACNNSGRATVPRPARKEGRRTVSCAACGKDVSVTIGRYEANTTQRFFCDAACMYKVGSRPRTRPDRICENCSTSFRPYSGTGSGKGRFCSKPCLDEWQARNRVTYECEVCGKEFHRPPSQVIRGPKWCSLTCSGIGKTKRAIPGRWHNGKPARHTIGGYVMVYEPDNPDSHARSGWILEHRLVASQMIGRRLRDDEQVHHVNGQKDCNDPSNLQVIDGSEHSQITVAEGSQRRRAAQKRIQELEAEQARLAAELAALRARMD